MYSFKEVQTNFLTDTFNGCFNGRLIAQISNGNS